MKLNNHSGKTIIITGASSGIGKAATEVFAGTGARLGLVVRNTARGEQLVKELIHHSGNQRIQYFVCDLGSMDDVRNLAGTLSREYPVIDILVNNAGAIINERTETRDGYELTFAANHLGPFLLTNLLLDNLKAAPAARIINVASEAQRMGKIYFDDLHMLSGYSPMKAYCQSKLSNIMFTYELSQRLNGSKITVNAMHPGVVNTRFGSDLKGITSLLFRIAKPFMRSPGKAADTLVWLALSPELDSVSGKYFYDRKELRSIKLSYDKQVREKLWQVSEELIRVNNQQS